MNSKKSGVELRKQASRSNVGDFLKALPNLRIQKGNEGQTKRKNTLMIDKSVIEYSTNRAANAVIASSISRASGATRAATGATVDH